MFMPSPKVSVCIVAYNQAPFVRDCLESVFAQECIFDYEVIFCDDASTDGTASVAERVAAEAGRPLRLVRNSKNLGPTNNYLYAHSLATGEYVAHLDADDMMLPGKLEAQAAFLDRNPGAVIVWHRVNVLDMITGVTRPDVFEPERFEIARLVREDLLALGTVAVHSSKMYRADVRKRVAVEQDLLDYLLDVQQIGDDWAGYLPQVLGVYRMNCGGMTSDSLKTRATLLRILDRFTREYPAGRRYVNAHAWKLMLGDLATGRATLAQSLAVWRRSFHWLGFVEFLVRWPVSRQLRRPSSVAVRYAGVQ
jgi:glycosyltransferase involved in cell wall biosynthesis